MCVCASRLCPEGSTTLQYLRTPDYLLCFQQKPAALGTKCFLNFIPQDIYFFPVVTVYRAIVIRAKSNSSDTPSLGHLVESFSLTPSEMSCGHLTCFAH